MEYADFSDEFCRFIQAAIPAVDAAELLLILQGSPERWWEPAEALRMLPPGAALGETEAARYFEILRTRGLIALDAGRRMQYRPADETLATHVRTLASAYRERPVTLIRVIYAMRDSKIRSFADAFKLRK